MKTSMCQKGGRQQLHGDRSSGAQNPSSPHPVYHPLLYNEQVWCNSELPWVLWAIVANVSYWTEGGYIQITECYSVLKRNKLSNNENLCRNLKFILLNGTKPIWKTKYCMTPSIWYSRTGKTWRQEKDQWLTGIVREGMDKWNTGFLGWWTLSNSAQYCIGGYMSLGIFSKPIECTILKVNPIENYGLWIMMMCQCRFIICNKRTTLVGECQ